MSKKQVYIETYGCQMNTADTELVMGILNNNGYDFAKDVHSADVVFLNTCSIRENAEQRIYGRLGNLKILKEKNPQMVVGILGCMAERLKKNLIEERKLVDIIVGPDEYRRLPELMDVVYGGGKGIGVKLSRTETYDDIIPYREEGLQAWISVMRGCDKFCTYCVVPFTRGRERSRSLESIVKEVEHLSAKGFREVTLLGQNVNSYDDNGNDFADLLAAVASVDTGIRVRYMTSHPQDFSDKLLYTIAAHENLCNYIHLPVQSGSNRILELMNRTYTVEHYLTIIEKAKKIIPGVSFSTDIISGFPTETLEDHLMTLELMEKVKYDGAFMFKYSPREGTKAYRMGDDVPEEVKSKRLQQIIELQHRHSLELNSELIGKTEKVLVEGFSKKSDKFFAARTDSNKIVVIPIQDGIVEGDYVEVRIDRVTSGTLFGEVTSVFDKYKSSAV
ncbi:MAG: tRNA (N6-isopentenyl adenosine(37)-C2)-methylthiotransferase MiaB [Ignavibacteriaceae bacterium]|jgi:tRNA-2-methylthio-N6-dimethylallyladenosine synthase|nr:tRNA (N6-isopentenyl adenosine(37)-C2)-methylthiotransferase MiaB [Ignavibacteriaceae bacterium]MCC6638438.1 tRNA (N6-isopentenyl adenosine(37)-C2)-methylthiotransferase MiaB [Ignavibacteriaceae bacterium]